MNTVASSQSPFLRRALGQALPLRAEALLDASQFRRAVLRVILAPALFFVLLLAVSVAEMLLLGELQREVVRAHRAETALRQSLQSIIDMETGLRGYAIAKRPEFLEPYETGRASLPAYWKEVVATMPDIPGAQRLLTDAGKAAQEWQRAAENTRLSVQGAAKIDSTPQSRKVLMDTFRMSAGQLTRMATERSADLSDRARRGMVGVVGSIIFIVFTLGLALIFFIRREILLLAKQFASAMVESEKARHEVEKSAQELELVVQKRTADLMTANTELESFCYSVSHDLRAPLRGIDGFSQALLEDCSDQLHSSGQQYLTYIRQGVQRMGRLIDDLLALSRLSRKPLSTEEVDLAEMARDVARHMAAADLSRPVAFHAPQDALPVHGDRGLLESLMMNLLSNAWKFTSKNEAARVEFGSEVKDGHRVYFVRDNGVGFDMSYYDKLFGAFQRLHSARDFEGNGIGLATVRRIALRHGGEVWADSKVGQGTTFFFTLSESADQKTRLES